VVEDYWRREGREPGARECHYAQPDRFTVDFLFPDVVPRIALEVTRLTDGVHRAGVRAADSLAAHLSSVAEQEELGSWLIAVSTGAQLRRLRQDIIKVIRDAQPNRERMLAEGASVRPGHYSASDLMRLSTRGEERRFMAEHERLRRAGLIEVRPLRAPTSNRVHLLPLTDFREIRPFPLELQDAVDANVEKLHRVPRSHRALAVLVERFDFEVVAASTRVPDLGGEIDELTSCSSGNTT
jgi:hypothetical protein